MSRHRRARREARAERLRHLDSLQRRRPGDRRLRDRIAVVFSAHEQGKDVHVFVDETRPLLQGARLTAWELTRRGVPTTLICDNMAALVMREGKVGLAVVGADRIAANGDAANKIGTYGVALLCRAHGLPFYVAAPSSTFDLSLVNGRSIPIEERDPREITHGFGRATAPEGIGVYNPAFDVTPAELIDAIITERGVIRPVNAATIRAMLGPLDEKPPRAVESALLDQGRLADSRRRRPVAKGPFFHAPLERTDRRLGMLIRPLRVLF